MKIPIILTPSSSILTGHNVKDISAFSNAKPSATTATSELISSRNTIQISIAESADTYASYQRIQSTTYSNIDRADEHSFALSHRLNGNDSGIQGGLKLLPNLLESKSSSYQQDIRQYSSFRPSSKSAEEIDLIGFKDREKKNIANLTLQLKTKEGDVIDFSLNAYKGDGKGKDGYVSGFNGIEVLFEFEGELSPAEREQIDDFIQKLSYQADRFFRGNDVDIDTLDLSSFTKLEDIELSLSDGRASHDFSFSYHDDMKMRSIKISQSGNRSELTVDKSSMGAGILTKQSLQSFEELLLKSTREAHADRNIIKLMKNVFALGFKNLPPSIEQSGLQQSAKQPMANSRLIGLPDFNFSLNSKVERPNQAYRPSEYQGFSVDLSLKTKGEKNSITGKETLTQTQNFALKGAYYTPVGLLENPDFDSQTYNYTKFERSSEHVTQLISQKNRLVSAVSTEFGENNTTRAEYHMGKKVDENSDGSQYEVVQEFTEQLRHESQNKDLMLLDLMMINPYQIAKK